MIHRTGNLILRAALRRLLRTTLRTTLQTVMTASLMLASSVAVASLSVVVDRTQITDADLLKLTVRVENATTASNPDFRALERDFEIVQMSGPNQSSRISIINGRQTSEVYVSWELRLRPKRLGTLSIPAFRIGSATSQPIAIQVARQSDAMKRKMSELVFFDTSVDTNETYVQGQIIYTIKLYYVENISGDFPPIPSVPDAVVETIESERRYDAITNGRRYYVLEKRYGIYPQKSGDLTIPAQTFTGYRVASGFFSTREPVLSRSESHQINVKAKPAEFTGEHWLPATNVTLSESWVGGPPSFTVGEPVNRSIEISADGVAVSLLPPLPDVTIDGAKTYQDPPVEEQNLTPDGINATQTIVIGIVPTRAGTLELPAIEIPWWNTRTDKLEVASIPAQSFSVAASPRTQTETVQSQETVPRPTSTSTTTTVESNPYWQYATYALLALWLMTLGAWFVFSRRQPAKSEQVSQTAPPSSETLLKDFKRACAENNVGESQKLLIQWGRSRYPGAHSLQALTRLANDPDLTNAVSELDNAVYAPDASGAWQGQRLWQAVQKLSKEKPRAAKPTRLAPDLNPV